MTILTPLQSVGPALTVVTLVLLIVVIVTVWSSIEVVDATEVRALYVLGEYRRVLQPGLNIVPPFVSRTTSVDRRPEELTLSVDDARSRDGEPVALEMTVEAQVEDPETAVRSEGDPFGATRRRATDAVYDAVRSTELDDVLGYPGDVGEAVQVDLRDAGDWGVEVRRVTVENVEQGDEGEPAA